MLSADIFYGNKRFFETLRSSLVGKYEILFQNEKLLACNFCTNYRQVIYYNPQKSEFK